MKYERVSTSRRMWWLAATVAVGGLIGWFDLSATEVQGPLLLVMLAAFTAGMAGIVPPWLAGAAVIAVRRRKHLM